MRKRQLSSCLCVFGGRHLPRWCPPDIEAKAMFRVELEN